MKALIHFILAAAFLLPFDVHAAPVDLLNSTPRMIENGEYERAVKVLTKLIKGGSLSDYNQSVAYTNRGTAFVKLDRQGKALDDFNEAITINPDYALAYVNRGMVLQMGGRNDEALANLNHAISITRDAETIKMAHLNRSKVFIDTGEYKSAVKDLNKLIAYDPKKASAFFNRAAAYFRMGNSGLARSDLDRALRLDPFFYEAYRSRAFLRLTMGDYQGAIEDCGLALQVNPKDVKSYIFRGMAHAASGEARTAVKDYGEALKIDPSNDSALTHRGLILLDQGELKRSEKDLSKSIKINPNDINSRLGRGGLYYLTGRTGRAMKDYTAAFAIDPKNLYAIMGLYLAEVETNVEAYNKLSINTENAGLNQWPGPIISVFLGGKTGPEVIDGIGNPDPEIENKMKCAAYYYLGRNELASGIREAGRHLFEKTVSECESSKLMWLGAKRELAKL